MESTLLLCKSERENFFISKRLLSAVVAVTRYKVTKMESSFIVLDELFKQLRNTSNYNNEIRDNIYEAGYNINTLSLELVGYIISELLKQDSTEENDFKLDYQKHLNFLDIKLNVKDGFKILISFPGFKLQFSQTLKKDILKFCAGFITKVLTLLFGWEKGSIDQNWIKSEISSVEPGIVINYTQDLQESKLAEVIDIGSVIFSKLKKINTKKEEIGLSDQIIELLNRDICFSIEEISGKLGCSKRSLQRKLKEVGTSFSGIKENIRKEMVSTYLKDSNLSIAETSDLLGYSERSAFERAFKKWYNMNPSEWKRINLNK